MSNIISVDIEATGIDWHRDKVLGVGIYKPGKYGYYGKVPNNLSDYIQVYHTGNFDIKWNIPGLRLDHDIANLSALLPDTEHSLEFLAMKYLKVPLWKGMVDRGNLSKHTKEEQEAYNRLDCQYTYELFPILVEEVKKHGQWEYYTKYMIPLRNMLNQIESTGIKVDMEKLQFFKDQYTNTRDSISNTIRNNHREAIRIIERRLLEKEQDKVKTEAAKQKRADNPPKFNANSAQQLLGLFKLLGTTPRDFTGKESTEMEVLKAMDTPLAKEVSAYRKNKKLAEYFDSYLEHAYNDYLYPFYYQYKAVTGRLSSSEPNIQQVPIRDNPDIRTCFIAEKDKVFVIADYSQIELRLAAHLSGDTKLCKVIKSGDDFHGTVAKDIFGLDCAVNEVKELYTTERNTAKTVVYLTQYGGGKERLQASLREDGVYYTLDECNSILKAFRHTYPELNTYSYKLGNQAMRTGYVTNIFKRKIWTPKEEANHIALNFQVQGSASDLTCFAAMYVNNLIEGIGRIVALIHDEIIIETTMEYVPKIKGILQEVMVERIKGLSVPLKVDISVGDNWGAK